MSKNPAEAPMGLALQICDTVIDDRATGKKSLIGLFDRIHAATFPCVHPALSVFAAVSSVRGEVPCEIICRHADGEPVALAAKGNINIPDPNRVVELVFNFKGVRFLKPGTYWLHFLVGEMPIMMRPLFLIQIKPEAIKPPEGAPPPASPGT